MLVFSGDPDGNQNHELAAGEFKKNARGAFFRRMLATIQISKTKGTLCECPFVFGDPDGNRSHLAVLG